MNLSQLLLLENHIKEIIIKMIKENDPDVDKLKDLYPLQYRKAKLKAFW